MQIMSLENLAREILNRYNKTPQGWHFLSDTKNHVMILGPDVCYRLNIMPWTPTQPVGIGARVQPPENAEKLMKQLQLPQYGFRVIKEATIKTLLNAVINSKGVIPRKIMQEALKPPPISLDEASGTKYLIEGVRVKLGRPLSSVISGQEELDSRLDKELDKLLRRKFPLSWASYG